MILIKYVTMIMITVILMMKVMIIKQKLKNE